MNGGAGGISMAAGRRNKNPGLIAGVERYVELKTLVADRGDRKVSPLGYAEAIADPPEHRQLCVLTHGHEIRKGIAEVYLRMMPKEPCYP